jgi:hypothetical protein
MRNVVSLRRGVPQVADCVRAPCASAQQATTYSPKQRLMPRSLIQSCSGSYEGARIFSVFPPKTYYLCNKVKQRRINKIILYLGYEIKVAHMNLLESFTRTSLRMVIVSLSLLPLPQVVWVGTPINMSSLVERETARVHAQPCGGAFINQSLQAARQATRRTQGTPTPIQH